MINRIVGTLLLLGALIALSHPARAALPQQASILLTVTPSIPPTKTPTNTACPLAPEARQPVVMPVSSPTSQLSQEIEVQVYAGRTVTVTLETGTFTGVSDATGIARISVPLQPGTVHHPVVQSYIPRVVHTGCANGGYMYTTSFDQYGAPLTIVQQSSTATPTPGCAFTLQGQVTDARTGLGVVGALVSTSGGMRSFTGTTDASGAYSIAVPDSYGCQINSAQASATGYESLQLPLGSSSPLRTLNFALQALGSPTPTSTATPLPTSVIIEGYVRVGTSSGPGLPNVPITVWFGSPHGMVFTDARGYYQATLPVPLNQETVGVMPALAGYTFTPSTHYWIVYRTQAGKFRGDFVALPPEPTTNPGTCHVTYTIVSQWPGGFQGDITVKNTGATAISGWALGWSFPSGQTITQLWNASYTQSGAGVTARNLSWNGTIAAGSAAQFGFLGTWSGSNAKPSAFTLNGATCTLAP